jgi:TRAP-type C4-dicarboxylate transport system permease small subunit
MIFSSFLQLILRLFFYSGIPWIDIFLRYLVLNTAMVAAAYVSHKNRHFALDAIFNFIDKKWHNKMKNVSNFFVCIILGVLIFSSAKFVYGEKTSFSVAFSIGNLNIPSYIFQILIPISFLLMLFHSIVNFFRNEKDLKAGL